MADRTVKEPFLFVAGVSKAGTTSLFRWFADHPQVTPCARKEPFYFVPKECYFDPPIRWGETPLSEYLDLFDDSQDRPGPGGKLTRMEASSLYFMFPSTARTIRNLFPRARVIVSLRDPVCRLESSYRMAVAMGWDGGDVSFSEYITRMLDWTPDHSPAYRLLLEEGRYSTRLHQWLDIFGTRRLRAIWFSDLKHQSLPLMRRLAVFADIDPDFYRQYRFRARNVSRRRRATMLERSFAALERRLPRGLSRRRAIRRLFLEAKKRLSPAPDQAAPSLPPSLDLDPALRRRLVRYYAEDIAPLTRLLDRKPPWADEYLAGAA